MNPFQTTALTLAAALIASSNLAHSSELVTYFVRIDPHHWLWLERIIAQDPDYSPDPRPSRRGDGKMYSGRSAMDLYTACGIKFVKGESIFYGPPTSQMVVRATSENRRRIGLIHQTLRSWKKGRFQEWHHEEFSPRKHSPKPGS